MREYLVIPSKAHCVIFVSCCIFHILISGNFLKEVASTKGANQLSNMHPLNFIYFFHILHFGLPSLSSLNTHLS